MNNGHVTSRELHEKLWKYVNQLILTMVTVEKQSQSVWFASYLVAIVEVTCFAMTLAIGVRVPQLPTIIFSAHSVAAQSV